ncbi:hypothetical protein QAD02_015139 [Eretmocerus hayati]|uniref:Uncharacterized protein n=1 Tax=Eretmocerus hayati TaxID=131215 RepID=A0ACC2P7E3_9HYME|nr:hypothetical protein QAD02_015139 [Eretmocerus hayati]
MKEKIESKSVPSNSSCLHPHEENSFDNLKEERRRNGRYLAGGVALAMLLIVFYHTFARGALTAGGFWTPSIIMAAYILWVLYVARKDQPRATELTSADNLAMTKDISSSKDVRAIEDGTITNT